MSSQSSTTTFPETIRSNVACLVDYCRQRIGPFRRGFDFGTFYRELREHAGDSTNAGPMVTDIAFLQFLREKVHEMKRER